MIIHKQILLPLRPRFGVMAKQYVIQPEPKELLRGEQRHTRLLGRTVSFALIALHTSRHEVGRRAFAALCPRQDVIKRQVFGVTVVTAILTAVTVTNVNTRTLHRSLTPIASHVDVVPQPDDRRNGKYRRRRTKDIVAVVLFDKNSAAKP